MEKLYIKFISMPRGRRRRIEVHTDSQPQYELGDTAEDIEKKKRERGEEETRAGREEEVGWKERGWKGPSRWKRLRKEQKSDLEQTQILM